MKNRPLAEQWLGRAKSNLSRAVTGKTATDVVYEDLCFDCQQAGEKSLKALMVLNNLVPLPTHSLSVLIETLESHGIVIPDDVKAAVALSYYAVQHDIPAIMNPLKNMNTFRRSQWHGRLSHGLKAGFSGGDIPGNMTQCSFAHPAASSTATITSIRASVTRKGVMGRAAVKRNYLNSNVSSLR